MNFKKILAGIAAAMLLCGALADPVDTEYLVDMTTEGISALERRLGELGYLSGESDGVFDADTRSALESFQQANGLEVNGAAPTVENIENGSYPLASSFYAVTRGDADENTLALLKWICGEQGQALVERTGYTPLGTEP